MRSRVIRRCEIVFLEHSRQCDYVTERNFFHSSHFPRTHVHISLNFERTKRRRKNVEQEFARKIDVTAAMKIRINFPHARTFFRLAWPNGVHACDSSCCRRTKEVANQHDLFHSPTRLADSMICVNQSKVMHRTVNESVNVNVQCLQEKKTKILICAYII